MLDSMLPTGMAAGPHKKVILDMIMTSQNRGHFHFPCFISLLLLIEGSFDHSSGLKKYC